LFEDESFKSKNWAGIYKFEGENIEKILKNIGSHKILDGVMSPHH